MGPFRWTASQSSGPLPHGVDRQFLIWGSRWWANGGGIWWARGAWTWRDRGTGRSGPQIAIQRCGTWGRLKRIRGQTMGVMPVVGGGGYNRWWRTPYFWWTMVGLQHHSWRMLPCALDPTGAGVITRDCRWGTRMGLRGGGPLNWWGGRATPPSSLWMCKCVDL